MKTVRLIASILLAIPLIIFGGNYFVHFFEMATPEETNAALDLLQAMRDGGLMAYVAAGHFICGILLLIPKFRLLGALMHLPLSIGMVGFHLSMMPEGLIMVLIILALNILAAWDTDKIKGLI